MKRKILVLEPYYGGSHKLFLDGLSSNIKGEFTFMTLPARKWKMRMQLAALWFACKIQELPLEKRKFDLVLCSTFVDVAVLRSQLSKYQWWDNQTLFHVYFHENQFSYPGQTPDPQRNQFTSINFTSAVAADFLAFNSRFNLDSFLAGINGYLKKAADMSFAGLIESLKNKSMVIYPGLDFSLIDKYRARSTADAKGPVIIWNHRWEHDKDPECFFSTLYKLSAKKIPFQLIVLGQSFRNQPACFSEARQRLAQHILHFGYVNAKQEYASLLRQGDIVISTARHEFFGISVIEAVRAGCFPLLPDRLAYPELFGGEYLYQEGKLLKRLTECISRLDGLDKKTTAKLTDRFQWTCLKKEYEKWLFVDTV